jgi:cytochrome b561
MNDSKLGRYTYTAIFLHWATAALVLSLFALGWYMVDLPRGPDRSFSFALHKSIGLTVFMLGLVRVVWRIRHRPPFYPSEMGGLRIALARAVHHMFYILLVLQPVSGYLSSSFSGYKTRFFGIALPHWGWRDSPLNELFTEIHVMCSLALAILIVAHILGALAHLTNHGDHVFRRMSPF